METWAEATTPEDDIDFPRGLAKSWSLELDLVFMVDMVLMCYIVQ
jgi:hypothetical protein